MEYMHYNNLIYRAYKFGVIAASVIWAKQNRCSYELFFIRLTMCLTTLVRLSSSVIYSVQALFATGFSGNSYCNISHIKTTFRNVKYKCMQSILPLILILPVYCLNAAICVFEAPHSGVYIFDKRNWRTIKETWSVVFLNAQKCVPP